MSAKQQVQHLKLLAKNKSKVTILRKCPNSVLRAMCECATNVLKGNVPLSKSLKSRLLPYKKVVRKLGTKSLPLYKKRELLTQKGEGFLISAALSVLTSLIDGSR
ncbi:hypothetical protein AVEN_152216-1 [Araneus ventricosus]|uniref:Uncharacterized protein n=1 Tax=Araneus ventricosus TaxID=182803 RepID=A0A4Y2HL14_ARAVE|nr:hypothetical protein AVEN_152216-1 [Araneus ventricosus]